MCCVSISGAQHEDWVTVKDTVNAYVIAFPETPEKKTQDVSTVKGSIKMDSYMLSTSNDVNIIYMTSFSEYPKSFFKNGLDTFEAQNKVLSGSVNGAITNTKGKLVSDENITFNGYPGRKVRIEVDNSVTHAVYVIEMKTILAGYNVYLAQTICEKAHVGNARAKKFFDSLELINVKK